MAVQLPEWAVWFDVDLAEDGNAVRNRVLYGGRGGAKSWTVATKVIERALKRPMRILCVREYQNSIQESSKRLIEDRINELGLGPAGSGYFTIAENEIRGRNGTRIMFGGLHGKEASIKSFEGVDLVWVEEAATVSQGSIDALIPTIRREGSEIWWSYNPRYPTDPVDRRFRGDAGPPPGSIVVEVQWRDNPWFPEVLAREMAYDAGRDPDKHRHVWEGGYVERSEAQVFSNWQVAAYVTPDDAALRFGADWGFARDPSMLVRCFVGRWSGAPGTSTVVADPKGGCLFIDHEAYAIGVEIDDTPALFAGSDTRTPPRWSNTRAHPGIAAAAHQTITADGARPDLVSYMQMRGFQMKAARKGSGSVEDGIAFLKNYEIYVHPRCRHAIEELTYYRWKVDKLTGAVLPKLEDANNHVIDALRYATEGARVGHGGFDVRFGRSARDVAGQPGILGRHPAWTRKSCETAGRAVSARHEPRDHGLMKRQQHRDPAIYAQVTS